MLLHRRAVTSRLRRRIAGIVRSPSSLLFDLIFGFEISEETDLLADYYGFFSAGPALLARKREERRAG